MATHHEEPGFGSLRSELLDQLKESSLGEHLIDDMRQVAEAYGFTMLQGQVLEFAAKLAEPALQGPLDDDGSREHVERSLNRSLFDAIEQLQQALTPNSETSSAVEALHVARRRRNALAHHFWFGALPAVMTSKADAVKTQLDHDQQAFEELTRLLFEIALKPGVTRRGVDVDHVANAASLLAVVLLYHPHEVEGLQLIDNGDALINRLQALADEERAWSIRPDSHSE